MASRLSENPDISVLLLERGSVSDTWISRIPIISSNIFRPDGGATSWNCEPMIHCDDRKSEFYCGEVMGGGSRINAMVYTRGCRADYDAWAALGHSDWSYGKVLPYFVKGEKTLDRPNSKYRGDSGIFEHLIPNFGSPRLVTTLQALGLPEHLPIPHGCSEHTRCKYYTSQLYVKSCLGCNYTHYVGSLVHSNQMLGKSDRNPSMGMG